MNDGSTTLFACIIASLQQLLRQFLSLQVPLVIPFLDQLDSLSVSPLIPLVNPHNPPLTGERLSEIMQLEVFIAWIGVSDIIVALWLAVCGIDLPGTIVAEFIHEAVFHCREDQVIDSVAVLRDVILLVDVWVHSSSDSHHPEEFVDIVARVTTHSSVDDQDVIDIQPVADLKCLVLRRTHSETNSSDVGVVPGVVID